MKSCGKINLSIGPWGGANSNQFAGGVEMDDKRVYIIPYSASAARFFDPASMTLHIPSGNFSGTAQFSGGELISGNRVFMTPYNSTVAKVYDAVRDAIDTYSHAAFSGNYAFNRQIKLKDGSGRIFLVPYNSTVGLMFDPSTNTFTPTAGVFPGNGAFAGGCDMGNGVLFLSPAVGTKGGLLDYVNNTFTLTNCNFPGAENHITCKQLQNGDIFLCPHKSSSAMLYHPLTDTNSVIVPANGGTYGPQGTANFIGCEETDDHMIYITPFQSTVAKVYNQFNNTLINVAGGYHSGGMFRDVIKLTAPSVNGRLFPIPFNTTTAIMVAS
jgi:hypothetical protein